MIDSSISIDQFNSSGWWCVSRWQCKWKKTQVDIINSNHHHHHHYFDNLIQFSCCIKRKMYEWNTNILFLTTFNAFFSYQQLVAQQQKKIWKTFFPFSFSLFSPIIITKAWIFSLRNSYKFQKKKLQVKNLQLDFSFPFVVNEFFFCNFKIEIKFFWR